MNRSKRHGLTDADRIAIRKSRLAGTPSRVLAERYGITRDYVNRLAGRDWSPDKSPMVSERSAIVLSTARLDQARASKHSAACSSRIRDAIEVWRARGLADTAIARQLQLTASVATGYGLAVREDVADPFGMDPRRRQGRAA